MNQSQFEAKTFGLGELIAQRKLFRVPRHQRSYAWTSDAVESFLDDVERAFVANASQYFVGLVVIQGPDKGEWTLLDGQQRLTTTTMIYAAIRDWLKSNKFPEDARQIETDYLGVRRLGGDYSSRMLLNEENKECYTDIVIPSGKNLWKRLKFPRNSSNRLLVNCYSMCRKWLSRILTGLNDSGERAQLLFRLSGFLENKVKAVCVEVSSEVDAYVLFEALNDRGTELSALDLIKNHIFSKADAKSTGIFDHLWSELMGNLDGGNPDDFLKVFWTSKYGITQKDQLFIRMRETYADVEGVELLLRDLARDSEIISALEESEHPMWSAFPVEVRDYIYILNSISAKQTRSVLLAAFHKLSNADFAKFLPDIISSVVRFQIIGRQRTGVVERVLGRICSDLSNENIKDIYQMRYALRDLYIDDNEFIEKFSKHKETKAIRISYFLSKIENHLESKFASVKEFMASVKIGPIYIERDGSGNLDGGDDSYNLVGNFALFDKDLSLEEVVDLSKSPYMTTKLSASFAHEVPQLAALDRTAKLGGQAVAIWRIEFPGDQDVKNP